nr:MAG TPA: hypothetical protein [Caudoviricetes sp.]
MTYAVCDLDYFSLYAVGCVVKAESLIHIPRLYWAGFFYALYRRPVMPCIGLLYWGYILQPPSHCGACGAL